MDLPLLYADTHYVVLNKPAGLKVHPGPGGGPSVENFLPSLSKRRDGPWLVHRLDADTSGCLLVALRKQALITAQTAFAEHRVRKTYWAVVRGGPLGEAGEIDAPLAKITDGKRWQMVVRRDGQAARTSWQVLGRGDGLCWLELVPHTGRTHQLRVHCAAQGWPMLGDELYGTAGCGGLHLMSRSLALPDSPVAAIAPPPPHMLSALRRCGFAG